MPFICRFLLRFVRFREDKDTANDENVVKKILRSIKDGVTKEQLLERMERIRTAWKMREKGIPIPPPISAEKLSEADRPLSSTSMTTPTSATPAVFPSPSVANPSTNYFQSRDPTSGQTSRSRQNSADLTAASRGDRRYSDTDLSPSNIRSKFESQTLHQVPEEQEEEENSKNTQSEREASPQALANPGGARKRFKSWTGDQRRQSTASNASASSSYPTGERRTSTANAKDEEAHAGIGNQKLTTSVSAQDIYRPIQRSETSPELSSAAGTEQKRPSQQQESQSSSSWKNITGVPENNNKPVSAPPKIRHSSSSNIHSLLTTTIEPNAAKTSHASSSSGSPPVAEIQQQEQQQQQQQQQEAAPKRCNRAYDFATILQSNNEAPVRGEQPLQAERYAARPSVGQVQFINYHADGMAASKTGFVRVDSAQNPPSDWKHYPYATEHVVPPEHKRPYPYSPSAPAATAADEYPPAASAAMHYPAQVPPQQQPAPSSSVRYAEHQPGPYYHHERQRLSGQNASDSQPRKRSSKAMLDFILN